MTRVELFEPDVGASTVTFRWAEDPPSTLYHRRSFSLEFPPAVDLARVPRALWWRIALLCLHPHWAFLRPCIVRIPVRLRPGEREAWLRLVDAAVDTLEAARGTSDTARAVDLVEGLRAAPAFAPVPASRRCAAAFSGGKDSLLTAGLLSELTERPVLVTTTSPLPPLHDHATPRRRHVLSEIARRRDAQLVEVRSDFRSATDNHFGDRMGYPVAVSETTDTHLYLSALLAAGLSVGATHLFVASENEVQENVDRDGRVVQHTHFMYAATTLAALHALFRPAGVTISSLTPSLHSEQVQRLLWTRYADLSDLQYSCWRVGPDEATCSRCSQCLRVALAALAAGGSPARMGIDLGKLLDAMRDYRPDVGAGGSGLPNELVARRLRGQIVRALRALPFSRVAREIARGKGGVLSRRAVRGLLAWPRLVRRNADLPGGDDPRWRRGYLRFADPLLADRLAALYAGAFPEDAPARYEEALARSVSLADWISAPLAGESDARRNAS